MNTRSKISIPVFVMVISLALVSSQTAWRQEPDSDEAIQANTNLSGSSSYLDNEEFNSTNGIYLYLPSVMKDAGLPSIPSLYDIDNGDGDGSYTINWSSSSLAASYKLEEDDIADFSSPIVIYSGSDTTRPIVGKPLGNYFYRVMAENGMGSSGWSEVKLASVTKQEELICETHDFGTPGVSLQVLVSGSFDYFVAENNMLIETVEVKSMLKSTFPTYVYVAVGINGDQLANRTHSVVGNVFTPYYINRTVANELHEGDQIYYYISKAVGDPAAWIGWANYVKFCGR